MKSRRFGIVLSIAVIVGALALMVFRWPAASEAVYPAERLVLLSRGAIRNCLSGILSGASAVAENARLRREVSGLSLLRGDVARLTAENDRLRRALDFRARQPEAWLAANVLSSGGGAAAARRSIRVDKGTLAGVRAGSAVVVPEGLVGRVTAVSPHTSEVTLVTDPSVKVSCAIGSGAASRVHGILSGGDSDGLFLRHLAPVVDMEPQSRVFTSGRGGVFPPGIDIGTLLLVTNGVRGVEGEVLPSVDYSALEVVFIRSGQ